MVALDILEVPSASVFRLSDLTLKTEAAGSSETLVLIYKITGRYIWE
jgi:hypothetical protein